MNFHAHYALLFQKCDIRPCSRCNVLRWEELKRARCTALDRAHIEVIVDNEELGSMNHHTGGFLAAVAALGIGVVLLEGPDETPKSAEAPAPGYGALETGAWAAGAVLREVPAMARAFRDGLSGDERRRDQPVPRRRERR